MMSLRIVFLAIAAISAVSADTCNICDDHVACNNDGSWDDRCQEPQLIEITPELRNLLLDLHNEKRNTVAAGDTKLSAACRMAKVVWDDDLAKYAEFNVKQCTMNHDTCRNTENFKYAGQNLAYSWTTAPSHNTEQSFTGFVQMWYDEIKDVTQSYIDSYPKGYSGPAIGHFTALVQDKGTHIGCAASTYKKGNENHILLACNTARTNMLENPVYKSCSTGGEECSTGTDATYTSLCTVNEDIDQNSF